MKYIDTNTSRYPLFPGDIQLEYPDWNIGDSLPSGWFEVQETAMPSDNLVDAITYEAYPELVDGTYRQTWATRELTEEEIMRISIPQKVREKFLALNFTDAEIDFILRTRY